MAATDARPVPRKNAAWRVYFAIRKNDGTLITTWAGQDSEVSLDGAAFADCTNEATEVGTSGCGYLDLTSSEMNADEVTIKITVTNTSALPLVLTVFPEEAGDYRVADTQKVDLNTIKTQALTAASGITFGVYVGGAEAAAPASTALSTATWTTTIAERIDVAVSTRLAPTTANRTLLVAADGTVTAALDSAVGTQIDNIENASGYLLAVLAGACADPQTASETYAITVFGSTFTVDMAGQTSTGTRTAPTLTKA